MSKGTSGSDLAKQILAGGTSTIDFLNTAFGDLKTAADALGNAQATGNYTAAPVLSSVALPSYMGSGAGSTTTVINNSPVFNVTQSDPYTTATYVAQQLKYL